MKKMLVVILAISIVSITFSESFAEKNTFFDSVKFIQYLDENTALEEVRNGNLDIYYDTVSADRLENHQDREGLQVYDATSRFYSILVNPAESEKFNPFSDKDSRFALNYLVDRNLIVNELMGGYGSLSISYYGTSSPEFLTIIEELETFNFKYNPTENLKCRNMKYLRTHILPLTHLLSNFYLPNNLKRIYYLYLKKD